jgi:hypothetical protein
MGWPNQSKKRDGKRKLGIHLISFQGMVLFSPDITVNEEDQPHCDARIGQIKDVPLVLMVTQVDEINDLSVKNPVDKITHGAAPNEPQGESL